MWRKNIDSISALPSSRVAANAARGALRVPKVREYAEIKLEEGQILTGYVFIDATMRIQDLLNGAERFFPFVDDSEEVHLINKAAVTKVRPFD